ncbi:MAG: glutamine-hydrolyzing carbamoyl-phosphate synthase small subunit [Polyangiaceae bacterium]|nr:glutamine-hydrolyzing carbamoyl-phosphate synthase small subunit [Polyangiaceae bacterium]MCW5791497.1 glutamine-hydrolyzing carbamoyl-phosphate synthase small subunit [Polyangiaceae bacterium]
MTTHTPGRISGADARPKSARRAHLALADGAVFEGFAWGAEGTAVGEVVFTTGMTGYQEILTDPSYTGQLVTMTAPQIGNTGVNLDDAESSDAAPQVSGFILRDPSLVASNYRAENSLAEYLTRHGVVAIGGVDTRRLTRHLRDHGSQNGCIGSEAPSVLVDQARAAPSMQGLDLVSRVTPKASYRFEQGRSWPVPFQFDDLYRPTEAGRSSAARPPEFHVVAYDYGAKKNIFRCLVDAGMRLTVVPAGTTAAEALALSPDGIFLSNGPGDPAALPHAIAAVRELLGKKPLFGICLGHQLLAHALGGATSKMKFGHRGLNHPVRDLATGRVEITSQNHGFVVDTSTLKGDARATHVHLNDGTNEGLEAPGASAFSVQYHPESAAGPHDSLYLFDRFVSAMRAAR